VHGVSICAGDIKHHCFGFLKFYCPFLKFCDEITDLSENPFSNSAILSLIIGNLRKAAYASKIMLRNPPVTGKFLRGFPAANERRAQKNIDQ
jgi:hypothetical protein